MTKLFFHAATSGDSGTLPTTIQSSLTGGSGFQSVYNVAQDSTNYPCHVCSPATGGGYACLVNTAGNFAFGEIASANNGLVGQVITQIILKNAKVQVGGSGGTITIKIVLANGTLQYTFATGQTISSGTGTGPLTFTDTGNTYVMQAGDGIFAAWDVGATNGLAVSCNSQSVFGSGNGESSQYNGSSVSAVCTSNDLAAQMFISQSTFQADAPSANRSMDTNKGVSETTISVSAAATGTGFAFYYTRFITPPLTSFNTTLASDTWNVSFAIEESSGMTLTQPDSTTMYNTLYLWRPSTGAKIAVIIDGNGSGFNTTSSTSETSVFGTFSGASTPYLPGDILCYELYFLVDVSVQNGGSSSVFYDGVTVQTTGGSVVSNMAAYIESPNNSNLFTPLPIPALPRGIIPTRTEIQTQNIAITPSTFTTAIVPSFKVDSPSAAIIYTRTKHH
jgi:hypothetical protein